MQPDAQTLLLNPYCPCPKNCDPHYPGAGWPLVLCQQFRKVGRPEPEYRLWCENCNTSFSPEEVLSGRIS